MTYNELVKLKVLIGKLLGEERLKQDLDLDKISVQELLDSITEYQNISKENDKNI